MKKILLLMVLLAALCPAGATVCSGLDFHILIGSPAVDAGIAGPLTDKDGTPRPQGKAADLGAFELH